MKIKRAPAIGLILAACVLTDQLTKAWAIAVLRPRLPASYWGDCLRIAYTENPGAFLSLGARLDPRLRFWLLSVLVGAFLLVCLGYLLTRTRMGSVSTCAYALVVGGGCSNLADRLLRAQGRVVDFLNLGIGSLRTGVFNLADVYILTGVGMLLLISFKDKEKPWPKT